MKQHLKTIGKNDEWLTPPEIIKVLGEFDLDPCAPIMRPWETAKSHYTINDNGLNNVWFGRVWLNPPFNRYQKGLWMKKMAEHNNGIMLLPLAGETQDFKNYVWGKCSGVLVLSFRPHFYYVDGTRARSSSGCTICLIAYGSENFKTLKESGLGYPLLEA